jgi:Putative prokaryotic signal transducing protein
MSADSDWETIAEPTNEAAAQIVLGLLQSESIPARVQSNVPVPGLGVAFKVQVAKDAVQRAREVLANAAVTEDELTQLAMNSPRAD